MPLKSTSTPSAAKYPASGVRVPPAPCPAPGCEEGLIAECEPYSRSDPPISRVPRSPNSGADAGGARRNTTALVTATNDARPMRRLFWFTRSSFDWVPRVGEMQWVSRTVDDDKLRTCAGYRPAC